MFYFLGTGVIIPRVKVLATQVCRPELKPHDARVAAQVFRLTVFRPPSPIPLVLGDFVCLFNVPGDGCLEPLYHRAAF